MQRKEYGRDDWFRRDTWDEIDQEEFFARLKRSRGQFHKAQYLRIQALYIQKECPEDALKLLEMVREEYPEPGQLSSTFLQTAECLVSLGRKEEAIEWYRKVLENEKVYKGVLTSAYLDFPVFIVTEELKDLFPEAQRILVDHVARLTFPVDRYLWNMTMALIDAENGELDEASKHARAAIEASQQEHSGFRYHPKVGLVKEQDERIQCRLEQLAQHIKTVR